MPEYDSNLPQEFAHMPKRRGRTMLLLVALIVVFILGALFANLRHRAPSAEKASDAPALTTQEQTSAETPAPPPAE